MSNDLFYKLSGTHNSFLFLDAINSSALLLGLQGSLTRAQWSKKLASKHQVDGIVFVEKPNQQLKWDFFNADGSPAEMCGNAARCMVWYNHNVLKGDDHCCFETAAGQVCGKLLGSHTSIIEMPKILDIKNFPTDELGLCYYVKAGAPHFVINRFGTNEELKAIVDDLNGFMIQSFPDGINISFFDFETEDTINAITYERGVNDFTKACGTGAVAMALVADFIRPNPSKYRKVKMPGGLLEVYLDGPRPKLSGAVEDLGKVSFSS